MELFKVRNIHPEVSGSVFTWNCKILFDENFWCQWWTLYFKSMTELREITILVSLEIPKEAVSKIQATLKWKLINNKKANFKYAFLNCPIFCIQKLKDRLCEFDNTVLSSPMSCKMRSLHKISHHVTRSHTLCLAVH